VPEQACEREKKCGMRSSFLRSGEEILNYFLGRGGWQSDWNVPLRRG